MAEASIAPAGVPLSFVQGKPVAQRSARVLLGWLPPKDAVSQLLGRNPAPQDDLTAANQMIARARSAMATRPPTVIVDPVTAGDRALLNPIAERPEVRASFADVPWRIEWIDLTQVLSVQKMITTDGLDLRVTEATGDTAALVELCLPAAQPVPPLGAFGDQDGHGFSLSSLNPNLRIVGSNVTEALVSPSPQVPRRRCRRSRSSSTWAPATSRWSGIRAGHFSATASTARPGCSAQVSPASRRSSSTPPRSSSSLLPPACLIMRSPSATAHQSCRTSGTSRCPLTSSSPRSAKWCASALKNSSSRDSQQELHLPATTAAGASRKGSCRAPCEAQPSRLRK